MLKGVSVRRCYLSQFPPFGNGCVVLHPPLVMRSVAAITRNRMEIASMMLLRLTRLGGLILFLLAAQTAALAQEDPFQALVRPTPPLSPAEQQQTFRVPDGFVIELVAAEPDILKPMNLAFDGRGRLWVTMSQEYPYAAPLDRAGRDVVKVLEDRDQDGTYETITTFADGLNIPIGVYPYRQGAIVFSIPYIWNLQDTDGDGVADQRTRLYGPMGYERDTHGMNNSFRRGFDGWLYACHGFNNETRVRGSDGHEIYMQSGNTYRMQLDGSRVEHFTWGQVNPFGMAIDSHFNIFTADCHSKPIYQLLRGGYYPSFGKPHDGLGFVPPMMDHLHGSTAIAGVEYYDASEFPEEYRGNLFSGNVMTSRVNRNALEQHGSTLKCIEQPDFVATTDPWFRPVDIRLGPDGALYIADFYNRIIGHYEVPLDHPGRDRTSGRIWRIRYIGSGKGGVPRDHADRMPDLSTAAPRQLVEQLAHANATRRTLALDELVDRVGTAAHDELKAAVRSSNSGHVRSLALWALERTGGLTEPLWQLAAKDQDPLVQVHAIKILSERKTLTDAEFEQLIRALSDADAMVRRAAADAVARHPERVAVEPLLAALATARRSASDDALLVHGLRIALRNQLQEPGRYGEIAAEVRERAADELADISLAVAAPDAAAFLLAYAGEQPLEAERLAAILQHAARNVSVNEVDQVIQFARQHHDGDVDQQAALLRAVIDALRQRGGEPTERLRSWARDVARGLLESLPRSEQRWTYRPVAIQSAAPNPWVLQRRPSADGVAGEFLSSLPKGEAGTGTLRSPPFRVPQQLTFFIAGHSGFPDKPLTGKNFVQLVDAESGEVLAHSPAPRNDLAQRVTWDLSAHTGKMACFEVTDSDDGSAYAWLAVGRFEPAVVAVPTVSPDRISERQQSAAVLVEQLRLGELSDALVEVLENPETEPASRTAAARAWLAVASSHTLVAEALAEALSMPLAPSVSEPAVAALLSGEAAQQLEALGAVMRVIPARSQSSLAVRLAGRREGLTALIQLVEGGYASPRLLVEQAVAERIAQVDDAKLETNVQRLTAGLADAAEQIEQQIAVSRERFRASPGSITKGAEVFKKQCANCHQIGGVGAVIGPQLDGIGSRGLDRLLEDVLDPNRNVDVAFRTTTLSLADGRVVTGLLRREEGETLVLVNEKGEEFTVAAADVEEQSTSRLSLMPENVATTMDPQDLLDLLAYLLSK